MMTNHSHFIIFSIDALLLLMHLIQPQCTAFSYNILQPRSLQLVHAHSPPSKIAYTRRSYKACTTALSMGESIDATESNTTASHEQGAKETSSAWVTNFKYILPSSFRRQNNDDLDGVDVSKFDPNTRDSDPIFLQASTFGEQEEECELDEEGVIDVECYVLDERNTTSTDVTPALRENEMTNVNINVTKQKEEVARKSGWMKRLRNRFRSNDLSAATNETTISDNVDSEESQVEQAQTTVAERNSNRTTTSANDAKEPRHRRRYKPIFYDLETNDIDTTMQSKQRKWSRRRKRAVIFVRTLKNAAFLFIVTFLAGNVMNQFVDLDEEGSFEVHFGKALSSNSASSSSRSPFRVESNRDARLDKIPSSLVRTNRHDTVEDRSLGLVARAVQKVGPAVVRVETETDVLDSDNTNGSDDNIRGDIFDGIPEASLQTGEIDFGQGSGIIIQINGEFHILTNSHVVDGASRINVLLTDGRRFKAQLVGSDEIVDIAVLKILPEEFQEEGRSGLTMDLPVADFGDSDELEVGTFVTAIGSPGGLDNSCTIGIISGLKRCPHAVGIPDKAGVLQYIQTDAAINVGNSGGPLVDVSSGNIVGINTCIRANMEGTSFAIPINRVMCILNELCEGRRIAHGYLGVRMATMNPTLARYHNTLHAQNIPERNGVVIEKVFKKSPAENGGLKQYDFVSKIDGHYVTNADDAHLIIDQAPIGQDLSLTILRGENELVVQVKPEDLSARLKQLRVERAKRKKGKI